MFFTGFGVPIAQVRNLDRKLTDHTFPIRWYEVIAPIKINHSKNRCAKTKIIYYVIKSMEYKPFLGRQENIFNYCLHCKD